MNKDLFKHENFKVTESKITFDSVYNSVYAPTDSELKKANILLLPYNNYRDGITYCFSEYSEGLLQYLKENENGRYIADIAIKDEYYQVLELHSKKIDLGRILVASIALPFALNIASDYAYDKIITIHEDPANVDISFEVIVEDNNGVSKSIKYDGPASELKDVIRLAKEIDDDDSTTATNR